MSLAQAVQTARKQQSLTQRELAEKASVDVRSVKRLETGANTALKTVQAVCAVLNVTLATEQALIAPSNPRLSRKDINALRQIRDGDLPDVATKINVSDTEILINWVFLTFVFVALPFSLISLHIQLYRNSDFMSGIDIFVLMFSIVFSNIALIGSTNSITGNFRFLKKISFFNCILQVSCIVLECFFPAIFSILAIPTALVLGGIGAWGSTRMRQKTDQFYADMQHEVESIIAELNQPTRDLDALDRKLFDLTLEAKIKGSPGHALADAFQVLVWLIQDLRLGITEPSKMEPYFQVAGELAQNITRSDRYAAIVKARHSAIRGNNSLEYRQQELYKKGIQHLKALSREQPSHPSPA